MISLRVQYLLVDILHSAGLFIKPVEFEQVRGQNKTKVYRRSKDCFKITGLSGRKTGLDANIIVYLDMGALNLKRELKYFFFTHL